MSSSHICFTTSILSQFNNLSLFTCNASSIKPKSLGPGSQFTSLSELLKANEDQILNIEYKPFAERYLLIPMIKVAQLVSNFVLVHVLPLIGTIYEGSLTAYYLVNVGINFIECEFMDSTREVKDNLDKNLQNLQTSFIGFCVDLGLSLLIFPSQFLLGVSFSSAIFDLSCALMGVDYVGIFMRLGILSIKIAASLSLNGAFTNQDPTLSDKVRYHFGFISEEQGRLIEPKVKRLKEKDFHNSYHFLQWKVMKTVAKTLQQIQVKKEGAFTLERWIPTSTRQFGRDDLTWIIKTMRRVEDQGLIEARNELTQLEEALEIFEDGLKTLSPNNKCKNHLGNKLCFSIDENFYSNPLDFDAYIGNYFNLKQPSGARRRL